MRFVARWQHRLHQLAPAPRLTLSTHTAAAACLAHWNYYRTPMQTFVHLEKMLNWSYFRCNLNVAFSVFTFFTSSRKVTCHQCHSKEINIIFTYKKSSLSSPWRDPSPHDFCHSHCTTLQQHTKPWVASNHMKIFSVTSSCLHYSPFLSISKEIPFVVSKQSRVCFSYRTLRLCSRSRRYQHAWE